ncbi:MAG: hypothetical protein ACE5Z5_02920 [Candidatus Bathyarchaeia archaeon]
MGRAVSNATPIIYLARIGRLGILQETYGDVLISPGIHRELTTGDYPEVPILRNAIQEGWLEVHDLNPEGVKFLEMLTEAGGLHEGEREVIAIAHSKGLLLLIDEDERTGRHIAKMWGVEVKGTLRVVVEGYEKGVISYEEARDTFHQLLAQNFRVSIDVYLKALSLLEEVRGKGR